MLLYPRVCIYMYIYIYQNGFEIYKSIILLIAHVDTFIFTVALCCMTVPQVSPFIDPFFWINSGNYSCFQLL